MNEQTPEASRRRSGNPHVDEDGRLRGAWKLSGYKRIEVGVVPLRAEEGEGAFFRNGALGEDVEVVIFTDCAGRFSIATADEVRAA